MNQNILDIKKKVKETKMIVSPDSSNTPYNNSSNTATSPLRNVRMVQVQECSQSQSQLPSSPPATNKYVITTKFPITQTQTTPPGIIKVSSLIPQVRPVPSNESVTYHTSTTQYPHIAVVTANSTNNNNNNNEFKVNPEQYRQDYSKPIHVDLSAHHQPQQQNHYQKYPVMDTTVSTAAKGEQDLNIGMFYIDCAIRHI